MVFVAMSCGGQARRPDGYVMSCAANLRCLVQVGNGIQLDTVGRRREAYRWRPCGVTWDDIPEQSL